MLKTKRQKLIFILSAFLMLIVLVMGLFIDVTRDAAKYAYISKEIIQNGDWFNLQITGERYFQKPPLLFWISAFSYKIFGISNFSFKLPVLLYSLLGFWAVYRLAKSMNDKKTALLSLLIISSSVITVLYNMDVHTDTILMTNVAFSLWFLYEYLKKGKLTYFIGASVFLGLCILTKGPFGVIVPFFSVLGYLLSKRDYKNLFSYKWLLMIIIALIVSLPAYLPAFMENGFKGLFFFFWDNNFRRLVGDYKGVTIDPTFYFHNLAYLILPWLVVAIAGFSCQFRKLFKKGFSPDDHFLFWGFWIVFLLLTVSKNKLPNYLYPLMPLLAVQAARAWLNPDFISKKWISANKIFMLLIWVLLFLIILIFFKTNNVLIWCLIIVLFLISIFTVISEEKNIQSFYSVFITAIALGVILNLHVFTEMMSLQGAPNAARVINEKSIPDEKIFYFNTEDFEYRKKLKYNKDFGSTLSENHFFLNYELMFYSDYPVSYIANQSQLNDILDIGNSWIYTDEEGKEQIAESGKEILEIFSFNNFDMRLPARYINPATRSKSFSKVYLIHL